jgi:hypothetical protein
MVMSLLRYPTKNFDFVQLMGVEPSRVGTFQSYGNTIEEGFMD